MISSITQAFKLAANSAENDNKVTKSNLSKLMHEVKNSAETLKFSDLKDIAKFTHSLRSTLGSQNSEIFEKKSKCIEKAIESCIKKANSKQNQVFFAMTIKNEMLSLEEKAPSLIAMTEKAGKKAETAGMQKSATREHGHKAPAFLEKKPAGDARSTSRPEKQNRAASLEPQPDYPGVKFHPLVESSSGEKKVL